MANTTEAPKSANQGIVRDSNDSVIHIMAVIDTAYIIKYYQPSLNPDQPTKIDHQSEVMVCSFVNHPGNTQGTADLSFTAYVDQTVSFWATSLSSNASDAVIIYGIEPFGSTSADVFNRFNMNQITRVGVATPNPKSINGLPAITTEQTFYSYDTRVARKGTENFVFKFAIYTLDEIRETQRLWGYCQWDPQIKVS